MLCQPFTSKTIRSLPSTSLPVPNDESAMKPSDADDEQHDAEEQGIQLSRCSLAGHGLAIGSGRAVRREANARQEASRTTPAAGVASATPIQCASCSMNPGCSTRPRYPARARTASRAVRPATPAAPGGSIADANPRATSIRPGAAHEALPLRARPTTTRPGQPDSRSVERPARSVCSTISWSPSSRRRGTVGSLDDLFRLEDLGAVEDRERRGFARMPSYSGAGELYELVAAQSAALTEERQQAHGPGRPHPLVDLAEGRLVHGHAVPCLDVSWMTSAECDPRCGRSTVARTGRPRRWRSRSRRDFPAHLWECACCAAR